MMSHATSTFSMADINAVGTCLVNGNFYQNHTVEIKGMQENEPVMVVWYGYKSLEMLIQTVTLARIFLSVPHTHE